MLYTASIVTLPFKKKNSLKCRSHSGVGFEFGGTKMQMTAEQEKKKKHLWISSIRESQINKEIIFVILSGTDDCSLVIC